MEKIENLFINNHGFTLIELMIVIVILGIIVSIGLPGINAIRNDAKINAIKNELRSLQSTLELYAANHNQYPAEINITDSDKNFNKLNGSYYYQTKNNGQKYAVWYTYINENGNNALIKITSESGLSFSTGNNSFTTNSVPGGY